MTSRKMILNLLALGLLLFVMITGAETASADDYFYSGDFKYSYNANSGVCLIRGYTGTGTEIVFPSVIDGHKVDEIYFMENDDWGSNRKNIVSITYPKGVSVYKYNNLSGLTSLKKIVLPEDLEVLTEGYCNSAPALTEIDIPEGVKKIGYGAFFECKSLKKVTMPNTVEVIESDAFYGCKSLKSVELSDSLKQIYSGAFRGCAALTNLYLPSGLLYVDEYCFKDCSSLTSLSFSGILCDIPDGLCEGCTSLKEVTISPYITSIGYDAFNKCDNLSIIRFLGTPKQWAAVEIPELAAEHELKNVTVKYESSISGILNESKINITKIVNTVSGAHLYWTGDDIAYIRYSVYRSENPEGPFTEIVSGLKSTNYTDKSVKSGKRYFYRIGTGSAQTNGTNLEIMPGDRPGTENKDFSDVSYIDYVSTPDITTRANCIDGIRLGWNKITGATGYAIYRKSDRPDDSWARVRTITGNATFTWTDTTVKSEAYNGAVYHYTVRALAGSDRKTLSGCRNTGRTMVRIVKPTLYSATKATANSCLVNWSRNGIATGYEVRFMVGSKVFKTVVYGDNTIVKKTINGLPAGSTYKIQVRAYCKTASAGTYYSSWSDPVNLKL